MQHAPVGAAVVVVVLDVVVDDAPVVVVVLEVVVELVPVVVVVDEVVVVVELLHVPYHAPPSSQTRPSTQVLVVPDATPIVLHAHS